MNSSSLHRNTEILYVGGEMPLNDVVPEIPAIYHSTAYIVEDMDDYEAANRDREGYVYSRTSNPTRDSLGKAISYLEGGEDTIVCSSGMAAISSTLIALAGNGDHIVVSHSIYGETRALLDRILTRHGLLVTYSDFTNPAEVRRAITSKTKLLYSEVITNPLIEVVDLEAIVEIAKVNQVLLVIDSTFTTPFVIKPLDYGADLVIQSLTKFYSGHGDVTAGSVSGSKELIGRIRFTQELLGGCADANSSWLALRSIRTMEMRMERHLDNAVTLAKALNEHPLIHKVYHPSLPDHPQHALASRIFSRGFGAMLSFRVEDNRDKVNAFIRNLKIVKYLGTLGGMRTSLAHPATAFRFEFSPEQLIALGMNEGFIRLSVGVEDMRDIINDIQQALKAFQL